MNHAEKLWDLANIITGFGVLQAVATIFAIAKGELKGINGSDAHCWAIFGTGVFTVVYAVGIIGCGCLGAGLDGKHSKVWVLTTVGRVAGVVIFNGLVGFALWVRRRDEMKRLVPFAESGSKPPT